jgi:starch synthase
VLETVKKLGWQPDLIHCNGWFSGMMALYIKHFYKKDPHFKETKVVYNLFNEGFDQPLDPRFHEKLKFDGFPKAVLEKSKETDFISFTKLILEHCDGVTVAEPNLDPALRAIFDEANILKQDYINEEHEAKAFSAFFDRVLDASVVTN